MPGLEVAARPWLYPYAGFGDTDIALRLKPLGRIAPASTPSLKTGSYRKVLSRCRDYAADYFLQAFFYDIAMARTISSVVNMAESKKMAPETLASEMAAFEMYWHREGQKLEDICRQMKGRLPELFFTLAPAEWAYPLHQGALPPVTDEELSKHQILMTLHIYNTMQALLRKLVVEEGDALASCGIEAILHWCMRFEFQKRGTIHAHVICWIDTVANFHPEQLTGRSGAEHQSPLVHLLEEIFHCSVDVQGGRCRHNLLTYVTGYVTKASDALQFRSKDRNAVGSAQDATRWRQVYRLLCKRSPLEQEIAMDMFGMSMVRASFTGAFVHAPVPGSMAINNDRHLYNAYQQWLEKPQVEGDASKDPVPSQTNFIEWCRFFDVKKTVPNREPSEAKHGRQTFTYTLRRRNVVGRGAGKVCAVAMSFPFELLDIYIGSWAAIFKKNQPEEGIWPRPAAEVPENMVHLGTLLLPQNGQDVPQRRAWDAKIEHLISTVETDLDVRGLGRSRVATFGHRTRACAMVLWEVLHGLTRAEDWSANQLFRAPSRSWSPEQQQALAAIEHRTSITDANEAALSQRTLQVTGGPGTGKTEVVIAAALAASEHGLRVLVGASVGLLVSMYRQAFMGCFLWVAFMGCNVAAQIGKTTLFL